MRHIITKKTNNIRDSKWGDVTGNKNQSLKIKGSPSCHCRCMARTLCQGLGHYKNLQYSSNLENEILICFYSPTIDSKTLKSKKKSPIICLQGWWGRGKLMVLCFEESRNRVGDGSFPAWGRGQGWSPEAACTWVVTQGITLERSLCPNTDRPPHLFHLSIHSFYTYWVSIMCHVPGSPLLLGTPPEPRPAMTHPSKLF